jgi:hypothetical protein
MAQTGGTNPMTPEERAVWFRERKHREFERLEKRMQREREGKLVIDKLNEAFSLARDIGWSARKFMLAARDVAQAQEPVPEADEEE